jgi:hypothetical protein
VALDADLEDAMRQMFRELNSLNALLLSVIAELAAGNTSITMATGVLGQMVRVRNNIVELKTRTGALQFARNIYGNQALDIITLLTAVQTALATAVTTSRAGLSSIADVNGWVGAFKLSALPDEGEQLVWREFTPAQTATLRTDLTSVRTAISALRNAATGT